MASDISINSISAPLKNFDDLHSERGLPLFSVSVNAGFPSPADDYIDKKLDLNEFLIKNPSATFFVRVEGDSMLQAGIHPDDILVVDRSLSPAEGNIVIAAIDGELTVKRISFKKGRIFLKPENPEFEVITVTAEMDFYVWGVVRSVIHKFG